MILLTLRCDRCKKEYTTRADINGVIVPLKYWIIVDNPMIMLDTSEGSSENRSEAISVCETCHEKFKRWKEER